MRGSNATGRRASLSIALSTALVLFVGALPAAAEHVADPDWFTEADPIAVTSSEGRVRDFERIGDVIFIGGSHTTLRDYIAGPDIGPGYLGAIERETGRVITSFQPVFDGEVRTLARSPDGTRLYVGGRFSTVNGEAWPHFVVLDPTTGQRIEDVKVTGGGVDDIQVASDGTVYLGGAFARINGVTRRRIGAFDGATGAVTSFRPADPLDTVRSIALSPDEDRVYYGGGYGDRLIDEFRGFLYAADPDDGDPINSFTPDVEESEVMDLAAHEDRVYAALGGRGGRAKVFRLDGSTRSRWRTDGDVQVVSVVGNRVIFGGHFVSYFGANETKILAAYSTGGLDYDPDVWFDIRGAQGAWAIFHDQQFLWLGGDINDARPRSVRGFARYTARTADLTPPTQPGTPTVVPTGADELTISWTPSEDDTYLVEYDVYRNGGMWRTVGVPVVVDRSVVPDARYEYVVVAVDRTGKESAPSAPGAGWSAPAADTMLVGGDDGWRYLDTGVAPPGTWTSRGYNHGSWAWGRQVLGFGEGDETTVVDGGPSGDRHVTTYFRRNFTVRKHSEVYALEMDVEFDDGVVAYLNGTEIGRSNMPSGTIDHDTLASGSRERAMATFTIDPALLVVGGRNTLAVEVHQASRGSSDLRMRADLRASIVEPVTLVKAKATWTFDDDGTGDAGWRNDGFDDSGWGSGPAPIGTGNKAKTVVEDVTTVYLRQTFDGADFERFEGVWLRVRDNDGYIIRLNGELVARVGVPPPPMDSSTPANRSAPNHRYVTYLLPVDLIDPGENLLTVEIHRLDTALFFAATMQVRP